MQLIGVHKRPERRPRKPAASAVRKILSLLVARDHDLCRVHPATDAAARQFHRRIGRGSHPGDRSAIPRRRPTPPLRRTRCASRGTRPGGLSRPAPSRRRTFNGYRPDANACRFVRPPAAPKRQPDEFRVWRDRTMKIKISQGCGFQRKLSARRAERDACGRWPPVRQPKAESRAAARA